MFYCLCFSFTYDLEGDRCYDGIGIFPGGLLYAGIILCLYANIILFSDRLLEDPISHLHENVHDISEVMYKEIKQLDNLKINLNDEEYKKYSRVLAVLESQSLIKGSHAIGKQFAKGLRIIDPTYVLYMCALFENSNEMEKLRNKVEACSIGQQLNGKSLQDEMNLPLAVIGSVFKIYESKGYGVCSNEIRATIYIGNT